MDLSFVGRESELGALRGAFDQARQAQPRLVLIDGPAGIGKTALIHQFLTDTGGGRILLVCGDETESSLPYAVIDQVLRQAGRPEYGLFDGSRHGPAVADHVSAGARVLEVLGSLQDEGPVVLVVDDAQWVDTQSSRSLLFALRRLAADRVLVVMAVRSEDLPHLPEGFHHLAHLRVGENRLTLRAFDADQVGQLAVRLGVSLPSWAAERLREHTTGNPLYVRALLGELPEETLRSARAPLPAPHSFEAIIERRVAGCSPEARDLVEAAAVLGLRCSLDAAARVGAVEDPVAALEDATSARLLEVREFPVGVDVAFGHPLVQAAIYQRLATGRRAALHLAAAPVMDDEWAALRHRAAAVATADDDLAAELTAFARREIERGAWARASASLIAASRLSVGRDAANQRLLEAIDAMLLSGDAAQAAAFATEIAGFPGGPMRDCVLGFLAMLNSRPVAAERLLRSAWELCDQVGNPALAATIARRSALHCLYRLRGEETVGWSRRALELTAAREPGLVVGEMLPLGVGLAYAGRPAEAAFEVDAAMAASTATTASGVSLKRVRGWLRLVAGGLDRAREDLAEEATQAVQVGSLGSAAFSFANLSLAEYLAGAWDDAARHGERALTITTEIEHTIFHALAVMAAVAVPAARGDWEVAEAHLRTVGPSANDYEHNVAALGIARAHLAAARGDHGAVLATLEPVAKIAPREGVDEPGCWLWQDLYGEALVGANRLDEAEEFLVEHERLAARRGCDFMRGRLTRARGRLLAAAGRDDDAYAAFTFAVDLLREQGLPFEQALVELAWGQALRRRGQRRAATERLLAARNSLENLLARPYTQRCEAELLACGLQPAKRGDVGGQQRLTPQELSVARLVASGLTNQQVASELMLSVRTVESHLTRVYAKLGVSSRGQLAVRLT